MSECDALKYYAINLKIDKITNKKPQKSLIKTFITYKNKTFSSRREQYGDTRILCKMQGKG